MQTPARGRGALWVKFSWYELPNPSSPLFEVSVRGVEGRRGTRRETPTQVVLRRLLQVEVSTCTRSALRMLVQYMAHETRLSPWATALPVEILELHACDVVLGDKSTLDRAQIKIVNGTIDPQSHITTHCSLSASSACASISANRVRSASLSTYPWSSTHALYVCTRVRTPLRARSLSALRRLSASARARL